MLGGSDTLYKTVWSIDLAFSCIRQALASVDPIPPVGISSNTSDVESGTLVGPERNKTTSVSFIVPAVNGAFKINRTTRPW